MFKKTICSVALAAVAACVAAPCAYASDGVFSVTSGTVKAGDEITLDVNIRDSSRLAGVRLFVKYDAYTFTLTDAQEVDFSGVMTGALDHEPFTFNWLDFNIPARSGTFLRMTFACDREALSGDYDFSLFYEEEDCIDIYGTPLDFEIEEGTVTVTGGKPAETDKPVVTTKTTDATKGTRDKQTTSARQTTQVKEKTTTKSSETQQTTDKDDSSEPDKTTSEPDDSSSKGEGSDKKTTAADSEPDTTSVTTQVTDSSGETVTTTSSVTAAAAAVDDNSSSADDEKDSKKGLIALIAFVGLCGIVAAVWLVFRIKKEK
ncbi:MAG: hypothetical protein IKR76_01700 [Ruminococcus sp.]|nr:hypothetical protein [Ruminococcus sp.]